jgi:hypothetical protein
MKGPSSKKKIITDDAEFFQTQQGLLSSAAAGGRRLLFFFFFFRIRIGDSCVQKATHFIKKKSNSRNPEKGSKTRPN